jgi:hypothetical protein
LRRTCRLDDLCDEALLLLLLLLLLLALLLLIPLLLLQSLLLLLRRTCWLDDLCDEALLLRLPLNGGLVCLNLCQNVARVDCITLVLAPRCNVALCASFMKRCTRRKQPVRVVRSCTCRAFAKANRLGFACTGQIPT